MVRKDSHPKLPLQMMRNLLIPLNSKLSLLNLINNLKVLHSWVQFQFLFNYRMGLSSRRILWEKTTDIISTYDIRIVYTINARIPRLLGAREPGGSLLSEILKILLVNLIKSIPNLLKITLIIWVKQIILKDSWD